MATIARMVIGIGADPSGLQKDLARSNAILRDFTRAAEGTVARSNLFGDLNTPARKAGQQLLTGLRKTLAEGTVQARLDLERGLINAAEFRQIGFLNAQEFNRGLSSGITSLDAVLDARTRAALVSQFRDVGQQAGAALGQGLTRVTSASASASRGLSLVRGAASALATQAVGVSGSVGTLAQGLLMFGAGSAVVTGIVAGIGLITLAWQHFTKETRNAHAEQQALFDEIDRAIKLRRDAEDPVGAAREKLKPIEAEFARVGQKLQEALTPRVVPVKGGFVTVQPDLEEVARLRREMVDLMARSREVGQSLMETLSVKPDQGGLVRTRVEVDRLRDSAAGVVDQVDQIQARLQMLQGSAAIIGITGPGLGGTDQTRALEAARALQERISTELRIQGQVTAQNALEVTKLVRQLEEVRAVIHELAVTPVQLDTKLIDEVSDAVARQMAPAIEAANVPAQSLLDTVTEIGTGARGLLQTADAMGSIGERSRRSIDGVLGLLSALNQIEDAQKSFAQATKAGTDTSAASLAGITGIIGAFGAGVSILQGLLGGGGPTAAEIASEENTRALQELRASLDRSVNTTNSLVQAQNAARGIRNFAQGLPDPDFLRNIGVFEQEFDRRLAQFGLTFDQLSAIAKAKGIQLIDANGNIVKDAFDDLAEALGISLASLAKFGASLDDQRARIEAGNRIRNLAETPGTLLADSRELLANFAPALFQELFSGLDTATIAGRDALTKRLQDLFSRIELGQLDPSQLGDFATLQELIETMLGIDDALDQMRQRMIAFSDTLSAQRSRLELQDALEGVNQSPAATIQRELDLLREFAPAIAGMFRDLDLTTAEGRNILREGLQDLFKLVDTGLITPAMLGDLDSMEDLVNIIAILTGSLNEMDQTIRDVTRQLLSVPTGFRIDQARFLATDPIGGFNGGGDRPIIMPPAPASQTWHVEVNVNGVNKAPGEIAKETVRELNRLRLAQGVSHWSEVSPQ